MWWEQTRRCAPAGRGHATLLASSIHGLITRCRICRLHFPPPFAHSVLQCVTIPGPRLQGLLRPENLPAKCDPALFEVAFVFGAVWAFGGALCERDGIKYRAQFDKWWKVRLDTPHLCGRLVHTRHRGAPALQLPALLTRLATPPSSHAFRAPQLTWSTVRFPQKGTVYDYFVNFKAGKFAPW